MKVLIEKIDERISELEGQIAKVNKENASDYDLVIMLKSNKINELEEIKQLAIAEQERIIKELDNRGFYDIVEKFIDVPTAIKIVKGESR